VAGISLLSGDSKFFAIIAKALTLEGQQFFTAILPGGFLGWRRMVYIFQQINCYWTWLKKKIVACQQSSSTS
jgi:hypothetical protein